jgi:hypothetical protein
MVAMAITTIIVTILVSITAISLDAWNRSRAEIRASRQAKTMVDTMARDFEAMVTRRGNAFEWLAAKASLPCRANPQRLQSSNARTLFLHQRHRPLQGKIGGDGSRAATRSRRSSKFAGNNVILNTPTGSGKSLVALALHFRAICQNRRSYYTVPIKALANEKFLSLCRIFGPENVGMITGDATVNPGAPVICCTAEILANWRCAKAPARVDDVIMDEFHYYSDARAASPGRCRCSRCRRRGFC